MLLAGKIEFAPAPINLILPAAQLDMALPYNCLRCKTYMFSINRDTATIWMGEAYPPREIPKGMGWIQYYCKGCKRFYNLYLQT